MANTLIATNKQVDESNKNTSKNYQKGTKDQLTASVKLVKANKESAIAQGLNAKSAMDAIRGVIKAKFAEMMAGLLAREITSKGFLGVLLGAGFAGAANQLFEKVVPIFAQGGDFVTNGEQLIRVGDNP